MCAQTYIHKAMWQSTKIKHIAYIEEKKQKKKQGCVDMGGGKLSNVLAPAAACETSHLSGSGSSAPEI